MIFSEWRKTTISNVATKVFSGGTPNTKIDEFWGGNIPWLSSGETRNRFIEKTENTITNTGVNNSSTKLANIGDTVIASAGQGFTRGQVSYCLIDTYINQSIIAIRPNLKIINSKFLFYNLSNRYQELRQISDANAIRGSLTTKLIGNLDIFLPSIHEQQKISEILSSIDDKIELNNKINKNLEEMAQAIFKSWFVDFEPFKDGEFIDSEIGMIPINWKVFKLKDFFTVKAGKKDANTCTQNGEYPFFSCSKDILRTSSYSFEGRAILVAGNGDFNVKYYEGKFEAYQRTYVLMPANSDLAGLLYFAIKHNLPKITKGFRGSVIKFITKGNIEDFPIALPNNFIEFSKIFQRAASTQLTLNEQNEKLGFIRDSILPKLMAGEIRVPLKEVPHAEVR